MKNFEVDKKVKYFLLFMVFFPLMGLFAWIFWELITDNRTTGDIYMNFKEEIECVGKVDSIYRQRMEHNILALKTENCIFDVAPDWETRFMVGDSISKKKGELIVKHYRNGKLIEVLDYRDIAKTMK